MFLYFCLFWIPFLCIPLISSQRRQFVDFQDWDFWELHLQCFVFWWSHTHIHIFLVDLVFQISIICISENFKVSQCFDHLTAPALAHPHFLVNFDSGNFSLLTFHRKRLVLVKQAVSKRAAPKKVVISCVVNSTCATLLGSALLLKATRKVERNKQKYLLWLQSEPQNI